MRYFHYSIHFLTFYSEADSMVGCVSANVICVKRGTRNLSGFLALSSAPVGLQELIARVV